MKNKILSFVLLFSLIIPCFFVLSGCGNKTNYKVSQEQWVEVFSKTNFNTYFTSLNGLENVSVNGNLYEKANPNLDNVITTYLKEENGSDTFYFSLTKSNTGEWVKTEIDISEYIYSSDYFSVLTNFLKDNYQLFNFKNNCYVLEFVENNLTLSLDINKITNIDNEVKAVAVNFKNGKLNFAEFFETTYDNYNYTNAPLIGFSKFGENVLQYEFETKFNTLTNFTLIGGKGIDYGEYYFTEDKFKMYAPNLSDITRQEVYWHKDTSENPTKYVFYYKNNDEIWLKNDEQTESSYLYARNFVKDLLFGYMKNYYVNFSFTNSTTLKNTNGDITQYVGIHTYKFKNVVINLNEEGNIKSANYIIEISAEGYKPVKYNYTLNAGNTQITLPNV